MKSIKKDLTLTLKDGAHREFRTDDFWRTIPAWKDASKEEFGDHMWQMKNSIKKVEQVKTVLAELCTDEFYQDMLDGEVKRQ